MNWNEAIVNFDAAVEAKDFHRISQAMDEIKSIAPPTEKDNDEYTAKFWAAFDDIPGFLEFATGNPPGYYDNITP